MLHALIMLLGGFVDASSLLTFAVAADEQPVVALDVSDLKDGDYVLTKKGDIVSVRPLKLLKPGIAQPGPIPTPTPNPPPGTLTPYQLEVKSWVVEALAKPGATATTGAGLSAVYSLAADGIESGSLKVEDGPSFVRMGTARVLAAQREEAQWSVFSARMDETITTLRAKGGLKTKEEYMTLFRQTAKAMDSATSFKGNLAELLKLDPAKAGILDKLDLAKIIELIKLIIELFKLFSP